MPQHRVYSTAIQLSAPTLWKTAVHEAAHVVVAHTCGFPVVAARISSTVLPTDALPHVTTVQWPFTPADLPTVYTERPWELPGLMKAILETAMAGSQVEGAVVQGADLYEILRWKRPWNALVCRQRPDRDAAARETLQRALLRPLRVNSDVTLPIFSDLRKHAAEDVRSLCHAPEIQREILTIAEALLQLEALDGPEITYLLRRTPRKAREGAERSLRR